MKRIVPVISLILIMAVSRCFAAEVVVDAKPAAEDKAVEAKATELLTGKTTRLDKITVLHSFVRDEIDQAKTQYG